MNVALVVLVVLVLVLCAGVFLLYNQEKGASNDAKIAKDSYNSLNNTYNDLSSKYAAEVSDNADLRTRYDVLNESYNNVTSSYNILKNQTDATTAKIGDFLESNPTVAYCYKITPGDSNNTTSTLLDVSVYNVGVSNVNNVNVRAGIKSMINNSTSELYQSVAIIPSLGKRTVEFDLGNTSEVQYVWVRLG